MLNRWVVRDGVYIVKDQRALEAIGVSGKSRD